MKIDATMWQASSQFFFIIIIFKKFNNDGATDAHLKKSFFQQYLIPSLLPYLIELIDIL